MSVRHIDAPELLTVAEMARADTAAIAAGVGRLELMEAAGRGAAEIGLRTFGSGPVAVLCGPGNNGGDGLVIARHLKRAGIKVRMALLGERGRLKGDAAAMAAKWRGKVEPLSPEVLEGAEWVVDALFGAGLTRAIDGAARLTLTAAEERGLASLAVDMPSGVHGDSGQVLGHALPAAATVTFFRAKPGHLLLPGRALCGDLHVIDISIPESVLDAIAPQAMVNGPDLFAAVFPRPDAAAHKYDRGHAIVLSGPRARTGAARLAAMGALRVGAGLVTMASPVSAMAENAAHLTAIMVAEWRGPAGFAKLIADPRRNAVLLGPGAGVGKGTRENVLSALKLKKSVVLDADALTAFARARGTLFKAIASAAS